MKKMTCSSMGGPCEEMVLGNTPEEMAANGTKHLEEKHPDMAKSMATMSQEDKDKWFADFKKKWDEAPDATA